jgi:hypothetical protein
MCANKKIQDISMKAAIGNHQILGLAIVSQRPFAVIELNRQTAPRESVPKHIADSRNF